ncbi:MAG TPA: hypothetical protein DDW62_01870, partial [Marinilabiliaceae bacterium]|nr:hypothetical protein [Marinilabiliaceae bacterium]
QYVKELVFFFPQRKLKIFLGKQLTKILLYSLFPKYFKDNAEMENDFLILSAIKSNPALINLCSVPRLESGCKIRANFSCFQIFIVLFYVKKYKAPDNHAN